MFNLENKVKSKKIFGKIMFYIILFSFFIVPYKSISDIIKPFILSYFITDIFIILFKIILEKLTKFQNFLDTLETVTNYIIYIVMGIDFSYLLYVLILFFCKKSEKIIFSDEIFSLLFFLLIGIIFLIPHIKRIIPLRIFKFDFEKKMMLANYFVYTIILIFMKHCLNGVIIKIENILSINIKYIDYQLIVCTVYLDRLKDMYSLGLICGTKEDIEKFEEIVEKNKDNPKLNYKVNKELIKYWEKYLEEDDSKLENIIKILSEINQEFFQCEKRKLDEKVDRLLSKDSSILNKSQKEDLKRIIKRKIKKDEILVLEFVLYKTDIEKIIGKVDG